MPYFEGPEKFATYWRALGYRYLAFEIGPSSPEYSYSIWRPRLAEAVKPGERGGMYKAQARYYLDAFDSLMALTQSKKVLFHEGDYWVLDLSARP